MARIELRRLLQKSNIRKPRHIDSTFRLSQMKYPQDILVGTSNNRVTREQKRKDDTGTGTRKIAMINSVEQVNRQC
jgi:hypothetical protein